MKWDEPVCDAAADNDPNRLEDRQSRQEKAAVLVRVNNCNKAHAVTELGFYLGEKFQRNCGVNWDIAADTEPNESS